jgi:hypothetical protein
MNFFIIGTDLNFNEIIKGSKQIPVKLHDATSELLRDLAIRRNFITSDEIKNINFYRLNDKEFNDLTAPNNSLTSTIRTLKNPNAWRVYFYILIDDLDNATNQISEIVNYCDYIDEKKLAILDEFDFHIKDKFKKI